MPRLLSRLVLSVAYNSSRTHHPWNPSPAVCPRNLHRKPSLLSPSTGPAHLFSIITAEAPEATAAPTAGETEEEMPMPEGGFMCEGEMGIRNKGICCAVRARVVIASGQLVFFVSSWQGLKTCLYIQRVMGGGCVVTVCTRVLCGMSSISSLFLSAAIVVPPPRLHAAVWRLREKCLACTYS